LPISGRAMIYTQHGSQPIGSDPFYACMVYIDGVVDGAAAIETPRAWACLPPGLTNGQIVDVVKNALRDHPETRQQRPALLIVGAISKAFPCPS